MDEFTPQTGGLEVKEGHEESDLSVPGIIKSAVALAVAGFASFFLMKFFLAFLMWADPKVFPQPPLTAAQRQLVEGREARPAPSPGEPQRAFTGAEREDEEARLKRTFPVPRLQWDDERDMNMFRNSEDTWLKSVGKDAAGNVHVPVEDAMQAIVGRGLPAVSGTFVPPTLPTAVPMVPATQHK